MTTHGGFPDWVDTGLPPAFDLNKVSSFRRTTLAAANAFIPITWGRDRLFGQLFVAHVDEDAGFLYVGYSFGKGEINSFESIFIDGILSTTWTTDNPTAVVETHVGTQGQSVSALLSAAVPASAYTDTLPGVAYIVVKVPRESTSGFPRVEAIIQGQLVHDLRNSNLGAPAQARIAQNSSPTAALRTASVSAEAWVEIRAGWDAAGSAIDIFDHTDGINDGWQLQITTLGEILFRIHTDTLGAQVRTLTTTLTNTLTDGDFKAIACTYDAVSERIMRIYINGEERGLLDLSGESFTTWDINWGSSPALEIGVQAIANVQDLRLWNDRRDAQEIRANYKRRLVGNEAGLAAYWPIYETSGTNIDDITSGSANDLTSEGSATLATSFVGLTQSTTSPVAYSTNPALCFSDFAFRFTDWIVNGEGTIAVADANDELVGGQVRREVGLTMQQPKTVDSWAKAWRVYMGCFMAWEDGELRLIPAQADVDAQGALTLDGTSPTWANVGDQAILDFTASEDFTLEAWFKVSTGGVFQAIAGKKQTIGGADAGYILYLNSSDQLACRIHDGTNTAVDNTTTETFNDAKWHHVAMTIDQTANEMILFINGVARTPVSISAVTGTLENAQAFRMGAESNGTSRFTGLIDEVRVWNDERTPAEITANLLDEITDPTTDSSLLGYWKFNDQVGTTAVDASSQGNDATLSGVAGFTFGNGLLIPDGVTMHFQADDIVANSVRLEKRSIRNFPTVVDIEYTDQTADTWRIERQQSKAPGVVEGTTPARFTKISLPGIHRPAQAKREAIERINWYLSDLEITFTAFDEGLELLQGSIIAVTHPLGLTGKLMRIKRLTNNSGRWTVEAVEYDPQIYSDEVIADPSTPDTILGNPLAPPKVTGLTVVEELFIYKNGITGSRVRATWTSTYAFASSFLVEGFVDGNKVWQTNVTTVNEAVSPSVEELVTGTPVEYDVRVSIVTPFTTGAVEIKTVTIQGKLAAPSAVPEIRAVLTNANTADITWDAATDLDIWRYDLRRGLTSDTFDTATKMDLVDGLSFVAQNLGPPDFENPGDIKFFIKAVDTVGNVSPTAATATITTALPATPTGLAGIEIAGEVRATWNANQASDFVERYRFAFSDDPETFETTIDTVDGQRILTKDAPVGTFTFKIFAINALGESTADTVLIEVTEDFGAFLVDSFAFIAPVLTNVHEFKFSDTLSTGDVFYVTSPDSDDPFDTSATPHDFSRETFALANYHVPVTGTYVTETKDFGQLLTGSWRATDNLIVLDGTVEFTMELSTDDISFDVYTSKSAKGQYRYGRLRYVSLTDSTMYIIRNPQKLDVSVIPIEESGEDTGSTSSFVRIELTREFGAVKEVNAQPKNALDAQMAVVDNIIVGKNTGIKFDGTNYLVGVDTAAFDIGATGVLSIEFWGNNPDSGSGQVFVCKKNSSTSTGWEIGKIASNSIRVTLDDGTSDVDFDTATTLPLDSTMHHIAVSIDRSADELSIYIDGVEDGNSPFNISGIANTLGNTIPFTIGARGNAGGALKNGTVIDEVRIWSDVRTSSEFADNRAIEIPITSTGLIGYWRMNDVLGTSVALADDQLLTPLTGNDLTNTGAGDLTYASISDTVSAKINYFDVYVFDIFGQQLAAQFQWNWKGV